MTQPDPSPSPEHLTLPETSVLPETAVLPDTTAVLLAAGEGRRLGRGPKALLPLGGEPLVAVLTRRLLEGGCRDVLVVTGAYADEVGAVAQTGVQPIGPADQEHRIAPAVVAPAPQLRGKVG